MVSQTTRRVFLSLACVASAAWCVSDSGLSPERVAEQELLDAAQVVFVSARIQQLEAEGQVASLASGLEALLTREEIPVAEVEDLRATLFLARAIAEAFEEQADEAGGRILDHQRRLVALEALAGSKDPSSGDAVSGTWKILTLPSGREGLLEIQLDGTLVSGSFSLDGGSHGSLRGTYVAGKLRLERIEAERGFDLIYEGRLNEEEDRLDGGWRTTLLGSPGPGGGQWSATRPIPAD